MSTRTRAGLAALAIPALLLTACGGDDGDSTEPAADSASTVTITDSRGEQEVPVNPERVVVYDIASLDTIDTLGSQSVVGVPQGNLPPSLEKYAGDDYVNVGDLFEPDLESLPEADPDLIIIGGRSSNMYDTLNDTLSDVPIVDLSTDQENYLDSVRQNITTIGTILDKESEAEDALAEIDDRISAIQGQTSDAGTALVLLTSGGEVTAYSLNSRFGFVFDDFGYEAATDQLGDSESSHGEKVSFEFIRDASPDRLLVIDRDAAIGNEGETAEVILDNPLVEETPAWQNDAITYVDATAWYIAAGGLTGFNTVLDDIEANLG